MNDIEKLLADLRQIRKHAFYATNDTLTLSEQIRAAINAYTGEAEEDLPAEQPKIGGKPAE